MESKAIIRRYGNSLMIPLTGFFKELSLDKGDIVKINLKNNKIIIESLKGAVS